MALDKDRLRDLIDTKMAGLVPSYAGDATNRAAMKAGLFTAIAQALVEEIQAHATVSGTDSRGDTVTNLPVT